MSTELFWHFDLTEILQITSSQMQQMDIIV